MEHWYLLRVTEMDLPQTDPTRLIQTRLSAAKPRLQDTSLAANTPQNRTHAAISIFTAMLDDAKSLARDGAGLPGCGSHQLVISHHGPSRSSPEPQPPVLRFHHHALPSATLRPMLGRKRGTQAIAPLTLLESIQVPEFTENIYHKILAWGHSRVDTGATFPDFLERFGPNGFGLSDDRCFELFDELFTHMERKNLVHRARYEAATAGENFQLTVEAAFKFLERIEIQDARTTSRSAMKWAAWSMVLTAAIGCLQVIIGVQQIKAANRASPLERAVLEASRTIISERMDSIYRGPRWY
ncbi:hypothetical protein O4H48_14140 [Rhodobacteraceae bacterium G21628-S1]|nr:hypothetical protein [Rhodobacteraceae bacterium G21628-S1]